MSTGAWIFMVASWGLIVGLNVFCLATFFRNRK
jgi:hypothetical protein